MRPKIGKARHKYKKVNSRFPRGVFVWRTALKRACPKFNDCDINYWINHLIKNGAGEILLQSIDKDGTGTGLDYDLLELIPKEFNKPVILSGGTGNYRHIYVALHEKNVNAVATSNLLNFLGDGLIKTRNELLKKKISFPEWNINQIKNLEYIIKK